MEEQSVPQDNERSRRFRLLSNEHRLKVLEFLASDARNVSELQSLVGIEQSLLSHHLSLLRSEGLVETGRRGKQVIYRLAPGVKGRLPNQLNLGCCRIQLL
jgi:ArsR family transcriptional regulator